MLEKLLIEDRFSTSKRCEFAAATRSVHVNASQEEGLEEKYDNKNRKSKSETTKTQTT